MKEIKYMPAAKHSIYSMTGNSKAKATSLRNMPAQKNKMMLLLSSPLLTS
jgi:hypothetical protein